MHTHTHTHSHARTHMHTHAHAHVHTVLDWLVSKLIETKGENKGKRGGIYLHTMRDRLEHVNKGEISKGEGEGEGGGALEGWLMRK